ncbi:MULTISPECIES: hypothetical protein [unclassified Nocardioides]|uniref:hypothetical protein n=1 Tax=unclassified Nocardioides TaxID=2615069 RepID=UPI0036206108
MAASTYDKLLVTHGAALRRKYGAAGAAAVRDALDRLVVADRARGLRSRVLLLDNTQSMAAIKAKKVADGDWVATLKAVDLATTRYTPAYLALVGATDVVPQARIDNPVAGDPDPWVPSDLPFACDLPDTWTGPTGRRLRAADLLAVTRVVGRIPDVAGASDPAMLLAALETAARYTQRTARSYQKVFSLTASAWKASTVQSVDLLPGPAPTTHLSPPEDAGWTKRELAGLTHFVNCHGGDTTPDWFGQAPGGAIDTVALRPEDVDGRIAAGTVVAAECCYGAMHLDPADIDGRVPLIWAYLRSGGYAGYGSSTTSYGPASGNGQADLLCRFALEGVLAGASTGRALLDARQRYVRETGALNPVDLKTLAQFDLLGDPSLVPVTLPDGAAPKGVAAKAVPSPTLTQRRAVLAATGRALGSSVPRAGRPRRSDVGAEELVQEAGLRRGQVAGDVTTYGEHAGGPRGGFSFHVLPVRSGEREGLVVVDEYDGARRTSTVWRK